MHIPVVAYPFFKLAALWLTLAGDFFKINFMKVLKKFADIVKPVFKRFPVLIFMGLAAAVFVALWSNAYDFYSTTGVTYDSDAYKEMVARRSDFEDICSAIFRTSLISMLCSIFFQLFSEWLWKNKELGGKKKILRFLPQVLSLLIFVPAFFIFRETESDFLNMAYGGILLILFVLSFFLLLSEHQKETFPNCIISEVIASITATCVGSGLALITFALKVLFQIGFPGGFQYALIAAFSFFVVFVGIFVGCATKNHADISIPKVFKIIVLYALVPLYLILLLVLYLYLLKSLFTWTMPTGKINPLVSAATAIYLLFYFCIRRYEEESKFAKIFCSWGVVILYPLIAVQCMAFGIRIYHYGFTSARYMSLFYIIFSILFSVLALVRSGKYMNCTFPVLAAMILVVTIGPFNAITVPQKNQFMRLENVFKKHGLLENGKIASEKAGELLSNSEKSVVASAYDVIDFSEMKTKPGWYTDGFEWSDTLKKDVFSFKKAFGFKYSSSYGVDDDLLFLGYEFYCDTEKYPLDVSKYKTLRNIDLDIYTYSDEEDKKSENIVLKYSNGRSKDLTDFISPKLVEKESKYDGVESVNWREPILIKAADGIILVLTRIDCSAEKASDGKIKYTRCYITGYEAELLPDN